MQWTGENLPQIMEFLGSQFLGFNPVTGTLQIRGWQDRQYDTVYLGWVLIKVDPDKEHSRFNMERPEQFVSEFVTVVSGEPSVYDVELLRERWQVRNITPQEPL